MLNQVNLITILEAEDNLNINVTGLRYFNVYGPHEHHKNNMALLFLNFLIK